MAKPLFHEGFKCAFFFYWIKLFFSRFVSTPSSSRRLLPLPKQFVFAPSCSCRSPKQFVSTPSRSCRSPKQFVSTPSRSLRPPPAPPSSFFPATSSTGATRFPKQFVSDPSRSRRLLPLPQAVRFRSLPQPSPVAVPLCSSFPAAPSCSRLLLLLPLAALRSLPLYPQLLRRPPVSGLPLLRCPTSQSVACFCYSKLFVPSSC